MSPVAANDGEPETCNKVVYGTIGTSIDGSRLLRYVRTVDKTFSVAESTMRIVSGYTPSNGMESEAPSFCSVIMGTIGNKCPA